MRTFIPLVSIITLLIVGCTATGQNASSAPHPVSDCVPENEVRVLQASFQKEANKLFRAAASKHIVQQGATLQNIPASEMERQVPFGVPQLVTTEAGKGRVHVGVRRGKYSGVLIARTPEGNWLVLVGKAITATSRVVRACKCQTHGGMLRVYQPPPAIILPTTDISKVKVIQVSHKLKKLEVHRTRCPGAIP